MTSENIMQKKNWQRCILQKKKSFNFGSKCPFQNPFFKDLNSGSMLFSSYFDLRKHKKKG